jgi:tRNA (guanine-N7-)-methyltransferase
MEIGFGGGEHLLHEARRFPTIGFLGVEPFQNGMAKAVSAIRHEGTANVRLWNEDARLLLDWLPSEAVSRIDLLYPDPWPKPRHWRRRFVQAENLKRIARCLRIGGAFRFASDVEAYVRWTLREIAKQPDLDWNAASLEECRSPWQGWPGTRYEAKAIREGRVPAYLTFRKGETKSAAIASPGPAS